MAAKKKNTKVLDIAIREDRKGKNPFAGLKGSDLLDKTKFVSVKEAVPILGCSHALYISQLIKAGRLEGIKLQLPGREKWFVSVESIEYYNANKRTRSGMRRWLLRCSEADKDKIEEAIKALGVEYTLEANYKPGKKKAKKVAEPQEEPDLDSLVL